MSFFILGLVLVVALVSVLVVTLLSVVKRLTDTNKQLLILLAGKEAKPDAIRALVASDRPPQKNLRGIATGRVKEVEKPKNTDYEMSIGVGNGL